MLQFLRLYKKLPHITGLCLRGALAAPSGPRRRMPRRLGQTLAFVLAQDFLFCPSSRVGPLLVEARAALENWTAVTLINCISLLIIINYCLFNFVSLIDLTPKDLQRCHML